MVASTIPGARAGGMSCALGGQLLLILAFTATGFAVPDAGFSPWNALVAAALALLVAGLVGLAASGLVDTGPLATVGLAVAIGGTATFLLGHVMLALAATRYEATTFASGGLGLAVGMTMTGIAVLRAGRWPGWSRFLPLVCGLYPVVLIPLGIVLGLTPPALAGFGLIWVVLGAAVYRTRPASAH